MWKYIKGYFYYHGIYSWRNILQIPKAIREFFFIWKNGFPHYAVWEHFCWFCETTDNIFDYYLSHHCGYPGEFEKYNTKENPDAGNEEWEKLIKSMQELLKTMQDDYDDTLKYEEQDARKDKFFELYSKYFYNFWD